MPGTLLLLGLSVAAAAASLDYFGEPPSYDESHYNDPPSNPLAYLLTGEEEANHGAFEKPEGEGIGDKKTPLVDNVLQPTAQTSFKIPTNGRPSPLFGAQPFTQSMLLFEEFGPEPYESHPEPYPGGFPQPTSGPAPEQDTAVWRSGPSSQALDNFLSHPGLYPAPAEFSNHTDRNPWADMVGTYLKRAVYSPAEGRPPGQGWAHQRYNEFFPQGEFKTVQAGSRVNGGIRDSYQMHGYNLGEFGPGGLYHTTYKFDGDSKVKAFSVQGTTRGIGIRFHPDMPIQDHKTIWTFDGTMPPKLLMARYGQPIVMRHYNALPIDPSANMGFGLHTISTHEHNGHNPAESDGFANAFFFPGQYYDYRWPLQLAGYDSINTDAKDDHAAFPCEPGETLYVNDAHPGLKQCENGRIKIRGDWRETMSTHWFHDHMVDFTAQNVYKGNAAMMNYYSAIDRGYEGPPAPGDDNDPNLRLPSGTARGWGNRDYDVNLVLADKAWDRNGQLWFNPFNTDGFLGDQILTNWTWKPYMDVRARSYRFRILNGSISRYFKIAVVKEVQGKGGEFKGPNSKISYDRVPFHMIANDGNIMEHAVPFDGSMDLNGDGDLKDNFGILPVQGNAERYDIIINFAKNGIKPGDKIYFVNVMEHDTGKGTKEAIPLDEVLSEDYKAVLKDTDKPDKTKWDKGDPGVGIFLQLRVQSYSGQDLAMNPEEYEPAKPASKGKAAKPEGKKMIPLKLNRDTDKAILAQARHRTFIFGRSDGTDEKPWTIKTDGGIGLAADPRRISAGIQLADNPTEGGAPGKPGTLEVWKIVNGGNGWEHPVHVHFEEGIILTRGGKKPPVWEQGARKDVYRVGGGDPDSGDNVEMAINFREFAGTYVEHCHNTQHEDNSMLLRWDLEHPGQFQLMPTPMPTWDGVTYAPSVALPTYHSGDGKGPQVQAKN